jgi:hypothetical protein
MPTPCQIKLATGTRVVRSRLLAARLPARLFTKLTREARASGYSCSDREALPSFSRWLLHNWALGEFRNLKGVRSNNGPRLPIKGHRVSFCPFESDRAGQSEPSERHVPPCKGTSTTANAPRRHLTESPFIVPIRLWR